MKNYSLKQTKSWMVYKRLLRRYRLATENLLRTDLMKNDEVHPAISQYRNALSQLDAFMSTHMMIRAVVNQHTGTTGGQAHGTEESNKEEKGKS